LLQGGGLAKMAGTTQELTPGGVKARKNNLAAGIKGIWNKLKKEDAYLSTRSRPWGTVLLLIVGCNDPRNVALHGYKTAGNQRG
jgi:hypothetical protein